MLLCLVCIVLDLRILAEIAVPWAGYPVRTLIWSGVAEVGGQTWLVFHVLVPFSDYVCPATYLTSRLC